MAMRRVASGMSLPTPAIFTSFNWPLISTCGARPGEKIRSLTCFETCNIVATIAAVDTLGAAGAAAEPLGFVLGVWGGSAETSEDMEISWIKFRGSAIINVRPKPRAHPGRYG